MKNFLKLLGIIALAAVIGFSFAACDDGSKDDKDGGGGTFTLTDIPSEYADYQRTIPLNYANCTTYLESSITIIGSKDTDWLISPNMVPISNGRVSIPLWAYDASSDSVMPYTKRYTGTEEVADFIVSIYRTDGGFGAYHVNVYFYNLRFTNGSATKSWDDADHISIY